MNLTSRLTDSLDQGQDSSPRAFLGEDHPLVRVSDWLGALQKQFVVTAALGMLSVIALVEGVSAALAVLVAVAAVGAALGVTVAVLAQRKRSHALTLIARGREELPIAAVRRERQRLLDPRHREQLAHWIEAICEEASHPVARPAYARPLFSPRIIASVKPQLAATTTALRGESPGVRGVLRAQQLLERGGSSLYGHDADALRRELRVIRFLLER